MKKFTYLSAEKQAELMPTHSGIKYHNARLNKRSENRNWLVDISCFHNPSGPFYYLKTDKEKNEPIRYEANFEFTNKKKALKFIEAINGELTSFDKNFEVRKYVKCPIDKVWRVKYYGEEKPRAIG
jgi:hypothetical protein